MSALYSIHFAEYVSAEYAEYADSICLKVYAEQHMQENFAKLKLSPVLFEKILTHVWLMF